MNVEYKFKDSEELKKLEEAMRDFSCSFIPNQHYEVKFLCSSISDKSIDIIPLSFPIIKIEGAKMQFESFVRGTNQIIIRNEKYNYRINLNPEKK